MYLASSPVPDPAPTPTAPPGPAPRPPPPPPVFPPPPASAAIGVGRVAAGSSSGGSSMWMRRNADRSERVRRGGSAMSTAAGAPAGMAKKFTVASREARHPPRGGPRISRPPTTSPPTTTAWASTATAAPGPSRRRPSGKRSPGSGGRSGEGGFTVPGVYPDNARRGAACCAPTPRRDRDAPGYFLAGSGGVKPMTWTPAPCAMSMACITSRYLRFGAALMNSSLAGRGS